MCIRDRRGSMSKCFAFAMAAVVVFAPAARPQNKPRPDDWSAVTSAIGRSGTLQSYGAMKYSFPRSDLKVTVNGVRIRPALALGAWVAFKRTATNEAMVQPVINALQQKYVQQTAVNNHLLRHSPRVVYVHIAAHGDAVGIATAI